MWFLVGSGARGFEALRLARQWVGEGFLKAGYFIHGEKHLESKGEVTLCILSCCTFSFLLFCVCGFKSHSC